MVRMLKVILVLGLIHGCGAKSKVVYNEVDDIETHYRMYKLSDWKVEGDTLRIDVQYGGGEIDPHEFELVRKRTEKSEIAELWLLHKTLADRAKALISTSLSFDIKYLLKDKNITKITLNQEPTPVKLIIEN